MAPVALVDRKVMAHDTWEPNAAAEPPTPPSVLPWRTRLGALRPAVGGPPETGTLTTRLVGHISSALFLLCGILVIVAGAFAAFPPGANRPGLMVVGVATVVSGAAIWATPWARWKRSAMLWLVPPAFALIVLHGIFSADDGFIYGLFYVVVFIWLGLGYPRGTSLRFLPLFLVAYELPLLLRHHHGTVGPASALYVVPSFVLVGETVAWVSDRLGRSESALTRSERRFRVLVEGAADIISLVDADGRITFETPAVQTTLGFDPAERVGRPAADFVHPDDHLRLAAALTEVLRRGGAVERNLVRLLHADGSYRWCEVVLRDLLDEPAVGAIVANFSDVTARRDAEVRLAESEANFRQLFAQNPQPMWVYDRRSLAFLEVNQAAIDHYGYSRDEFLAMSVPGVWEPSHREDVDGLRRRQGQDHVRTWNHVVRDGRVIVVEVASHDLEFAGRDAVLVAVKDITDQRALEAQLTYQAFHDSLTGLPNRALFRERVEYALASRTANNVHVLFIDLDRFKTVNDSLGHGSGDELLVAVAERLLPTLRDDDTLARLGGDEFAVLTLGVPDGGQLVARRILDALHEPFRLGGGDVTVSASIGVACDAGSAEELLRDADIAMYGAKSAGRNRYQIFDVTMHHGDRNRLRLESDLVHAIERHQLRVLYQPVVELHTDGVVGFEALARWEHPEFGTISPLDFIPIAEETGLIVPIGRWVLGQACAQARRWQVAHRRPLPLTMAVNVSALQLQEPSFVEEVQAAILRHLLPPETLTLEITESVLLDKSTTILERLIELKATGVRLAIDDFGTGYSSLSYLRQFPIDILKVDRSFTSLIEGPGNVPPLIEGLVFLGRQLGLDMVAEGIEIVDQRTQLHRLGCLLGQGFLWAPPLSQDAVDELLDREDSQSVIARSVPLPPVTAGPRSFSDSSPAVHPAPVISPTGGRP
ncbi:MAG TPA: EAL domain-containing protein [Acidimicrobiales bacterium]|nr:EAL domain-containing protein [Acidimicrobiales bacterium]